MDDDEKKGAGELGSKPVGYGNPPVGSRYPKGVSGHPGRKRGSKNKPKLVPTLTESEQIAFEEMLRPVQTSNGEMAAVRAVTRAQIKTAANGGTNAQKAFLARSDEIAQKKRDEEDKLLIGWESYVRDWQFHRDRMTPEAWATFEKHLIPHPDDVDVDWDTRTVTIYGPSSVKNRRLWEEYAEMVHDLRKRVFQTRLLLLKDPESIALQVEYIHVWGLFLNTRERLPARMRPKPAMPSAQFKKLRMWFHKNLTADAV